MQSAAEALEATLASDDRFGLARNEALVALCRLLAGQIDDAGSKAPTRLTAAYLSALKDLGKILTAETRKAGSDGDSNGVDLGSLRENVTSITARAS